MVLFLYVKEKYQGENLLRLNFLYLVEKIVGFHVDCRPQIRMVSVVKTQCSQWGPGIGINGQLAVCFGKLLGFIQNNISVSCKSAQWRVADPVTFYTRRTTIIFGNFRLHQISHVILSRYILGDRGIGGGVHENNANRFLLRING